MVQASGPGPDTLPITPGRDAYPFELDGDGANSILPTPGMVSVAVGGDVNCIPQFAPADAEPRILPVPAGYMMSPMRQILETGTTATGFVVWTA